MVQNSDQSMYVIDWLVDRSNSYVDMLRPTCKIRRSISPLVRARKPFTPHDSLLVNKNSWLGLKTATALFAGEANGEPAIKASDPFGAMLKTSILLNVSGR